MHWTIGSKRRIISFLICFTFFSLTLFSGTARGLSDQEGKRIEFLIASVEHRAGAKFVRNGSEYDGTQAGSHLRMKLGRAGDRVRSADEFINLCASKSSFSGKPYMIVFSGGKTIPAGDFFRKKLKTYRPTAP